MVSLEQSRFVLQSLEGANRIRLQQLFKAITPDQCTFLKLLPLIIHSQKAHFPFLDHEERPCGLYGYQMDQDIQKLAQACYPTFNYTPHQHQDFDALYLMGSTGTIAYSQHSDFDIWLCYKRAFTSKELKQINHKCVQIEKEAMRFGLEMHIFLVHIDSFREGQLPVLSNESSGSTQHHLLKDEFYRTLILLTGKHPLWWHVPVNEEKNYSSYCSDLIKSDQSISESTLDFGKIDSIPAKEYFGGSIWQLSKAIDSPYKSFIKLMLIEYYISQYPDAELLCHKYKTAIMLKTPTLESIDPYKMMVETIIEYLEEIGDKLRLGLLYRSFYSKVGINLSNVGHNIDPWKLETMRTMVKRWGWSQSMIEFMDSKERWYIKEILKEHQVIYESFAKAYERQIQFGKKIEDERLVSQHDLTVLGRKLFTAYERKADKIEIIRVGIAERRLIDNVTINYECEERLGNVWSLYVGELLKKELNDSSPVKNTHNIVELLIWAVFNRVINQSTSISVIGILKQRHEEIVNTLIPDILDLYPNNFYTTAEFDLYEQASTIISNRLYLNVGNQTDQKGSGLVSIDQVVITSWKEVFVKRYVREDAVIEALRYTLMRQQKEEIAASDILDTISYSIVESDAKIKATIATNISNIVEYLFNHKPPAAKRYIIAIGEVLFAISLDKNDLQHKTIQTQYELLNYLGSSNKEFIETRIDPNVHITQPLVQMYDKNEQGLIQVFYETDGNDVDIYVIDERGSLHIHRREFFTDDSLVKQYQKIFTTIMNRINLLVENNRLSETINGYEFYKINRTEDHVDLIKMEISSLNDDDDDLLTFNVIVDSDEEGHIYYTLYLYGEEYSNLLYGDELYHKVAQRVVSERPSHGKYPIYISDISMAPELLGHDGLDRLQSLHFLIYKQRIEELLFNAIQKLP